MGNRKRLGRVFGKKGKKVPMTPAMIELVKTNSEIDRIFAAQQKDKKA